MASHSGSNLLWKNVESGSLLFADVPNFVNEFNKKNGGSKEKGTAWRVPTLEEVTEAIVEGADNGSLSYSFGGGAESMPIWTSVGKIFHLSEELLGFEAPSNCTGHLVLVQERSKAVDGPAAPVQRRLVVAGYMDSPIFQQCVEAADFLNHEYKNEYKISITREFAFEFEKKRSELVAQKKTGVENHTRVLVADTDSGAYVSGEDFIKEICATTDFKLFNVEDQDEGSYLKLAQRSFLTFLKGAKSEFCWMTIRIGEQFGGRMVFQLYSDLCPRTCENFLHLCKGDLPDATDPKTGKKIKLSYKGTNFFRVVAGGWIQAGDITGSNGTGGHSIYGPRFPDECFNVAHDQAGILGMANEGEHTNNSQFYVTLAKAGWMNRRYVAFGRVVEGLQVLEAVGNTETRHNQSPRIPITIEDCGYIQLH